MEKYERKKAEREARLKQPRKTEGEVRESRLTGIAKAQEARMLKLKQRELVRQKVANGQEITEEERDLLRWKGGKIPKDMQERLSIAAAAKLVIKPQSVTELRVLVEKTAAKHKYNPIEELIELTRDGNVKETEKIAIHKALLPFLVPQLATPKPSRADEPGGSGVKVTILQYQFPSPPEKPAVPLHQEKPATVETTNGNK